MTRQAMRTGTIALVLAATALPVTGCVSPPGSYPDPNGPRDAKGHLVDPRTGTPLPGQGDDGI